MTLKTKVGGEWKEISALKVKIGGEWKDVSTLYSKKDGAWVTVYSSGALITFTNYPYPIPVAKGWKYSTDKVNWTTVTSDSTINDSGTFTGWVKAKGKLVLEEYYSDEYEEDIGLAKRYDGPSLNTERNSTKSFSIDDHSFVCGGYMNGVSFDLVEMFDKNEIWTTVSPLSIFRRRFTTFVLDTYGFICGGNSAASSSSTYYDSVDIYDYAGNRTSGTALYVARAGSTSFVLENCGFVCCGQIPGSNATSNVVDKYNSNGTRTSATSSSYGRLDGPTSFACYGKGFLYGGWMYGEGYLRDIDIYSPSGTRTLATFPYRSEYPCSFEFNNKGYIYVPRSQNKIFLISATGTYTELSGLTAGTWDARSFTLGNYAYITGGGDVYSGQNGTVYALDTLNNLTTAEPLSVPVRSVDIFKNSGKAYLLVSSTSMDVYYNCITAYSTNLPITAGSTYTFNGTTSTATESQVLSFNTKVSGTIKYREGEIPIIFSLIYDKSLASDPARCLTYSGLCKGFTPMVGGSGNANEGSWAEGNETIFDAIKVGYLSGSTFVEQSKSAVPGKKSYNCFTRIPKIYQKVTDISDAGDNSKVQLDISLKPFYGATLHPAFIMDDIELEYKDIGRYLGFVSAHPRVYSFSGYDASSDTRVNLRKYAAYNSNESGGSFGIMSYYDWDLVNKLILFAFKSWDTQSALGEGYTAYIDAKTTGNTDGKSWMYGTSSTSDSISVFGIEDWWGGKNVVIDNFLTDKSNIYVSNTASPTDSVGDMDILCALSGLGGGFPLTCRAGLNDFFIGETSGGTYSKGICDYQYFNTGGNKLAVVGGYNATNGRPGAFYIYSNTAATSGGIPRLVHWE